MSKFFRTISDRLRRLGQRRGLPQPSVERRRAPRFICSTPVLWEVGRESGEAQLREVSESGLKIRTKKAFLAGKHIRVRPLSNNDQTPLSTDVAIGTVVYSKARTGGFEVGIELINPERISRFAWIGQLTRGPNLNSPIPQVLPEESGLRLIPGGVSEPEREGLLKPLE